jgi:hypothetical protein
VVVGMAPGAVGVWAQAESRTAALSAAREKVNCMA